MRFVQQALEILDVLDFQLFRSIKRNNKLIELKKYFENLEKPKFPIKAKVMMEKYNLKEGKEFHCLFDDNPILKAGIKMNKELSMWHRQPPCKICNESWFDQGNSKKKDICDRCR